MFKNELFLDENYSRLSDDSHKCPSCATCYKSERETEGERLILSYSVASDDMNFEL